MPTEYLIVPAFSDQAGQCRIVCRQGPLVKDALLHYRANPQEWRESGLMNSRGSLVCMDAPKDVIAEFKACEPLMAGTCFVFE
ncbi:MAG: hypothetical protein ACH37Z_19565 [Anaerolineae bacterium]